MSEAPFGIAQIAVLAIFRAPGYPALQLALARRRSRPQARRLTDPVREVVLDYTDPCASQSLVSKMPGATGCTPSAPSKAGAKPVIQPA